MGGSYVCRGFWGDVMGFWRVGVKRNQWSFVGAQGLAELACQTAISVGSPAVTGTRTSCFKRRRAVMINSTGRQLISAAVARYRLLSSQVGATSVLSPFHPHGLLAISIPDPPTSDLVAARWSNEKPFL